MSDENTENDFNFNSFDNLKEPRPEYIIKDILETYKNLLTEYEDINENIEKLERRTEENKESIGINVKDLREKIIKIAEIANERSKKGHTHEEFKKLEESINDIKKEYENIDSKFEKKLDSLSSDLNDNNNKIKELNNEIEQLRSENKQLRERLNILANNYFEYKKSVDAYMEVQKLKNEALFKSVNIAKCSDCSQKIKISDLKSNTCPSCDMIFRGIEDKLIFTSVLYGND